MELRGTRVMVMGLGISGSAAARFLASRGASLLLTDTRSNLPKSDLPNSRLYLGGEEPASLDDVDLVVVSPGVPPSSKLVRAARGAGIPIIGELELASRFVECPIVAVTGTNGKSTVTTMIAGMADRAGLRTFVGGNLGTPLVEAIGGNFQIAVAEVSSYQLETIEQFKPKVAIHLNLTGDHLDRYRDLEQYGRAKARIFKNQDGDDWSILNRDDQLVWQLGLPLKSKVLSFGAGKPQPLPEAAVWDDAGLNFTLRGRSGTISLQRFRLPGNFNRLNAMAAAAAALALNLTPAVIERSLSDFRSLPHRLEFVREKDGITFFDDSKGTNVGAVVQALSAVGNSVILIAGGVDKGGSYDALREPLREKVKLLLLYGAARETMRTALSSTTRLDCVQNFGEAVRKAAAAAMPGDTVLLSPACASFDQFKDYAERGCEFQKLVRSL
jgi:UDP-N-acetylmuramoylalanine--D-glutamate ligase